MLFQAALQSDECPVVDAERILDPEEQTLSFEDAAKLGIKDGISERFLESKARQCLVGGETG